MKVRMLIATVLLSGLVSGALITGAFCSSALAEWQEVASGWKTIAEKRERQVDELMAIVKTLDKQRDEVMAGWRDATRELVEARSTKTPQ